MRLVQSEVTQLLYKKCGHGISCGVRGEGERLGFLVYFDDQEVSETYGEQIACCPRCGARPDHHLLLLMLQAAR
jgi:hypothetical protein